MNNKKLLMSARELQRVSSFHLAQDKLRSVWSRMFPGNQLHWQTPWRKTNNRTHSKKHRNKHKTNKLDSRKKQNMQKHTKYPKADNHHSPDDVSRRGGDSDFQANE